MQKNLFSIVFESAVRKWKIAFQHLSVSVHKVPIFLVFKSFKPWLSIIQKRLVELPPMILQAPLMFDSDLLRVMPLILCLRIFLAVQGETCLQQWNLHSWNIEIPHDLSVRAVYINFDEHSMSFSRTFLPIKAENQNLPANVAWLTQNSTFQTQ